MKNAEVHGIVYIYNIDDRPCMSEARISVATHVGADGHVLYSGVHRNSSFYYNNGWPRLTDCFLNTVLVWVPCAFLWCPLPFYLVVLARKGEVTPLHVTWLNSAKTYFSFILSMVALLSLLQDFKLLTDSGSDVLPVVIYLASGLRLVTYIYLGWRRDLEEVDLFDLNPRDSSDVLVPSFEREWELERERFRNKQRSKDKSRNDTKNGPTMMPSLQRLTTDSVQMDIHFPATVLETKSLVPSCSSRSWRGKGGVTTAYGTLHRPGDDEINQETPSLLRVLVKLVGPRLILGLVSNAVSEGILILCPVLLGIGCVEKGPDRLNTCCRLLIEQVTSPDNNDKQSRSGYVLALLMFLVYMVRTLLSSFSFYCAQLVGMQLKTILIAAIYKKSW
ncbi:hypothetical protein C0Q70_12796 [Pomacea canaliculata]|uniref:ABC transmembrane type-1 domain-containing protein n=1 Tax=Pomacea canaliculata TaxID=400727 RepID=A0A2T7P2J6_POMCA|nr:hypothetical protein C0Q70_12796 [Pomacea canaliculata]